MITISKFWLRVDTTGECWLWTGTIDPDGYGVARWRIHGGPLGRTAAHRASYELLVGPISVGMEIDHLCKTRACVRPDHLEAVTRLENWRRSDAVSRINADKTHCDHGHPFDEANTRLAVGTSRGRRRGLRRICRACDRRRQAQYQARKQAVS